MKANAVLQHVTQAREKSNIRRQIDENLRRVYDETVTEDVPDRFVQLLQQLKQQQGDKSDDS
ncbi:NepR family anti-sigma factor [Anianabacter salinae]|uniref:NepR family anti-sigma factor n=1 Tax=Anianabacter salinae TaxID=2851023 RepID=UPI00225DD3A4|nr:NepR family anti-sigma factor [Anianabacter salinae]MBV0913685.1 hypothetical protein [Anianabacter salinae]